MTYETPGTTRQRAHHHIPQRLDIQPHICKILTPHILLQYVQTAAQNAK